MRATRYAAAGLAAAALAGGCGWVTGADDLVEAACTGDSCSEGGPLADGAVMDAHDEKVAQDASHDATLRDAGLDALADSGVDAPDDAAADATDSGAADAADATMDAPFDAPVDSPGDAPVDAAPDGGCPTGQGPTMVNAGAFCIDSTEVTNAHYASFLAAKAGNTSGQPLACAWNATYDPAQNWPAPAPEANRPIRFVDWCDAFMYCAWAGKRLCGAIGGGPTPFNGFDNAAESQWFSACTHAGDGQHAYPYGNAYQPSACNTLDSDAGAVVDVASFPGCVGGYPGLFDMSGNVEEWEDSCTPGDAGPGSDHCRGRGSDWLDTPGSVASCDRDETDRRDNKKYELGIRCCAP